jgi:hypothetical protein
LNAASNWESPVRKVSAKAVEAPGPLLRHAIIAQPAKRQTA